MRVYATALWAMTWLAASAMAADAIENPQTTESQPADPIVHGVPIENGFVIMQGEYLPCPYTIGTRGEELFLNDRPLDTERLEWGRSGHGGFHRFRRQPRGPRGSEPEKASSDVAETDTVDARLARFEQRRRYFNAAARVECRLQDEGLLIVFPDNHTTFVTGGCELAVLETLLADTSREAKAKALMKLNSGWIESARWMELAGTFHGTPELVRRIEKLKQDRAANYRKNVTSQELSRPVLYGITVLGIVLGVVALGTLLSDRPNSNTRWRDIDTSGDSIPMAVRNIVLVVVLSFFDLGCTLLAQSSVGFVEMNPLGSGLLENPLLLTGFKVVSLLVSCAILLSLRRYRGAQIASWWMCLVCTILTFRWATYGTLFLG